MIKYRVTLKDRLFGGKFHEIETVHSPLEGLRLNPVTLTACYDFSDEQEAIGAYKKMIQNYIQRQSSSIFQTGITSDQKRLINEALDMYQVLDKRLIEMKDD